MTINFKGNFSATAIGSLPHTDAEVACEIMFKSLPEIPCSTQLCLSDYQVYVSDGIYC